MTKRDVEFDLFISNHYYYNYINDDTTLFCSFSSICVSKLSETVLTFVFG